KKRNDSEKSDKEEFSCTAAFQKILDEKEEPEAQIEEQVSEPVIPLESIKMNVESTETKLEKTEDILPIPPVMEKASTPVKELEEVKEAPIAESKGKKKNKKDKKQTPKPEEKEGKIDVVKPDEVKVEETPLPVVTPVETLIPDPVKEESKVTKEENIKDVTVAESPEPIIEDLSPKPKAKIAKPVEKKRKGKQDAQVSESSTQEILEALIAEPEQTRVVTPDPKPLKQEKIEEIVLQPTQQDIPSDITFTVPDEDEKLIAQEFELLAEKAMGKKRKKGPKTPKNLDIGTGIQEQIDTENKQTDIKDVAKEQLAVITEVLTPQTDQQEFIITSQKSDMPMPTETVKDDTLEVPKSHEFQGKELLTPETVGEEKEFTKPEETATLQPEDKHKSGKKRKKSPKPPKKSEEPIKTGERPLTPKPELAKEPSTIEESTQQPSSEKVEASNITKMYDIEISSIKADESEGSSCDVIPDVSYPRAASQQMPDNNNNTFIREVFSPIEPVPILQDIAQALPKSEEKKSPPKEEKTDLKSKMMEVNQDMEELRLSIERSLAELTSIEKSEENIEKEFETTRNKAKNVSDLLFDIGGNAVIEQMIPTESMVKETEVKTTEATEPKPVEEAKMPLVIDETKISPKQLQIVPVKKQKGKGKGTPVEKVQKEVIPLPYTESIPSDTSSTVESAIAQSPPKPEEKTIEIKAEQEIIKPTEVPKVEENILPAMSLPVAEMKTEQTDTEKPKEEETPTDVPPVCPARKDNKNKHKKKKGKQDSQAPPPSTAQSTPAPTQTQQTTQETKKEEKQETKTESKSESKGGGQGKGKGKQQASDVDTGSQDNAFTEADFEPIENFEDALTSSIDDVNKTFEMIVKESQEQNNPKINIIAPDEEKTPVSPPKNLLGHPDIPVRSNKRDFKKEKDKIPNEITARVKIKDSVEVEKKSSKNTQTNNRMKDFIKDYKMNDNDDFVYKYSFRKVFLQSACHVCKKSLCSSRVPCSYCNLLFYCSNKHKDEDWPQHQALCFAVSTIVHLKDQKHIYGDAKNLTGHDYRLIRMQMIVSCEKVLKRRLVPWEQEALLYPRVCAHVPCREWRQSKLSDCQGCGQISYCTDNPDHFPKSHSRWCKSYSLYEKLVSYQQTKGRLEPKMPTKVLREPQQIPEKINEVLASMYEEKIDINDIQYAALTQLATAPLTAAYCHQLCRNKAGPVTNGVNKKSSFTIHVVGAELQFEADALNKWEVFFLHLRPELQELRVVLINYNLNPSNLPLELLGKIKLCDNCRQNSRRVVFNFQDKRTYADYKNSEDFVPPDIVCAFNPSIQRSSVYNGKDPWPTTIDAILKLKIPFIITGYTITELHKDCIRVKECSETGYNFITEPKYNNFASVRPDRNFISDDEMPLLFKNYCFTIISA
ncbi:muscle M-line assembly protein unc-89, partial [Spodoptera frugiperda]|uniref:Muscle M-line assembly protein unc-89 n=1 Tax=Spodoptera frugiperda TaxID=7108 RepID=A0A9R0DI91_SPOFR